MDKVSVRLDTITVKEAPLNIDIEKSVGMDTKPSEPSLVPS